LPSLVMVKPPFKINFAGQLTKGQDKSLVVLNK